MRSLIAHPARTRFACGLAALALVAVAVGSARATETGVGTTTDPFSGAAGAQVYTVHGVVVHRIALESTFVLAGADGTMLAITGQTLPPFGRRAVVRVQRVGATIQEVSVVRIGAFVPDVHLHGTVSFVSPRGRRYTLSAGGASIGIRHRLKGSIPALGSVVTVGARETAGGLLVERRVIQDEGSTTALQAVGTLDGVIPPTTDPVLTSTEELASGCPNGCIVISGDDQGGAGDSIPIALTASGIRVPAADVAARPLARPPAFTALALWSVFTAISQQIQSAASAVEQAGKKPKGNQPIVVAGWNQVTNKPGFTVRTTAVSAPVAACSVADGDYAIVTSSACPSGTTRRHVSTGSLIKVTNPGSACVTGLTLYGTTTVFVTGAAGCIDVTPPSAPVTLK
jgi:hypothetical protein